MPSDHSIRFSAIYDQPKSCNYKHIDIFQARELGLFQSVLNNPKVITCDNGYKKIYNIAAI